MIRDSRVLGDACFNLISRFVALCFICETARDIPQSLAGRCLRILVRARSDRALAFWNEKSLSISPLRNQLRDHSLSGDDVCPVSSVP